MRGRAGASLAEMLLVSVLFAMVLAAVAGVAGAQSRLAGAALDGTRLQEILRVADIVLGSEVRALAPADISALGPDSLRLRAFRGGGRICAGEADVLLVRYQGVRRPEPAKDSVLILGEADSRGAPRALRGVSGDDRCGGSLRLQLVPEPRDSLSSRRGWVLVFESGAYHLSGGALRYRRGAGGRQPLTEEGITEGVLTSLPSALEVRVAIRVGDRSGAPAAERTLRLPSDNGAFAP